jgi:hypothetical protein
MIRKSNKRNNARYGDDDDRNRNFHAVNVVVNGELSMLNIIFLIMTSSAIQTSDLRPLTSVLRLHSYR